MSYQIPEQAEKKYAGTDPHRELDLVVRELEKLAESLGLAGTHPEPQTYTTTTREEGK